jgi:hypothetical protein
MIPQLALFVNSKPSIVADANLAPAKTLRASKAYIPIAEMIPASNATREL